MTIVLMGVSGSGKTTVGTLLARELDWPFVDGDDLHPPANVAKMSRGIPLDDPDRWPWLLAIRTTIQNSERTRQSLVVACSALKEEYRTFLNEGTHIRWVYLAGTAELLRDRLANRPHHFMKSGLLNSQLEALEAPADALTLDISLPVEELVRLIRQSLGL